MSEMSPAEQENARLAAEIERLRAQRDAYMDDVDDVAMFMFTKGQVARMWETQQGPRNKLGRS